MAYHTRTREVSTLRAVFLPRRAALFANCPANAEKLRCRRSWPDHWGKVMNTFRIARSLGEHVVAIFAEHSERGLYGMRIMVDGALWDYRQSENVMKDAIDIFAEAFAALVVHTGTHVQQRVP